MCTVCCRDIRKNMAATLTTRGTVTTLRDISKCASPHAITTKANQSTDLEDEYQTSLNVQSNLMIMKSWHSYRVRIKFVRDTFRIYFLISVFDF